MRDPNNTRGMTGHDEFKGVRSHSGVERPRWSPGLGNSRWSRRVTSPWDVAMTMVVVARLDTMVVLMNPGNLLEGWAGPEVEEGSENWLLPKCPLSRTGPEGKERPQE